MRQAVFVLAMVAAAFLGGAMVNGPGVRWVQARILDYMGLKDGGEIASISLSDPPSDPADAQRRPAPESAGAVPAAPKPGGGKTPGSAPREAPRPTAPAPAAAPTPTPAVSGSRPAPDARVIRTAATAAPRGAAPDTPPAPLDLGIGPALLASLAPARKEGGAAGKGKDDAIPLEVAPPSSSASPPPVAAPAAPAAAAPGLAQAAAGDWPALRRKMQALGVSRYSLEGVPGGRVTFSCLIPLAGRQAVTQRFEGEGDDEAQAAQSAIRRVTLWRASQGLTEKTP